MRPVAIVGAILIAFGAVVLVRGVNFSSRESVLKLGDVNVTAKKNHDVPVWAGAACIAGGVLMLGAGMRARR